MKDKSMRTTDRSLPIALLRARERVMEPVREMLSRSGISEQKWRVLRVVEELGPVEQTVIADKACLLLPSLTRMLQSLERDGLLERVADTVDRRKSNVLITEAGRALVHEHLGQSNAIFERLENALGKRDYRELLDLLEKLQTVKY